jgi:outer membrane protein assembly factor BamB
MRKVQKLLIQGVFLAVTVAVLAGCGGKSNVKPPAELKPFTPSAQIATVWSNGIGSGADGEYLTLAPAISDNVAYTVSFNGRVYATDTKTGNTIWSTKLDASLSAIPVVSQDKVFVGSIYGKLFALDRKTGKEVWKTDLASSLFSSVAYSKGKVIAYTHDGTITAYNAETGAQEWTQNVSTPSLILVGNSTPLVSGDTVFVGFDNGELWAFNLSSGEKLWDRPVALPSGGSEISRMVDIEANPVISDGVLYIATYQGNLVAMNLASGKDVWIKKFSTYTNFSVTSTRLYVTNADGYVMALDKQTGDTLWKQKLLEGRSVTGPAVIGDYVAVADFEGYVHFFDRDSGKYADRIKVGGDGIRGMPMTNEGELIVQTNSGSLVALKVRPLTS